MSANTLNLLSQLNGMADTLAKLPETGGPLDTVREGLDLIIGEALQGSNQAGSDPEDDTIWSDEELQAFCTGIGAILQVLINNSTETP